MAGVDYPVNMTLIRGNYEVSVVITSSLTAWGTRDLSELRTLRVLCAPHFKPHRHPRRNHWETPCASVWNRTRKPSELSGVSKPPLTRISWVDPYHIILRNW